MFIKHLFGLDLPKAGKVKAKSVDGPRYVIYPQPVGRVDINKDPIYWLGIQPKGSRKVRNVPVSKKEWDAAVEGEQWTAATK